MEKMKHKITLVGGKPDMILQAFCACGWGDSILNHGVGYTTAKKKELVKLYQLHKIKG